MSDKVLRAIVKQAAAGAQGLLAKALLARGNLLEDWLQRLSSSEEPDVLQKTGSHHGQVVLVPEAILQVVQVLQALAHVPWVHRTEEVHFVEERLHRDTPAMKIRLLSRCVGGPEPASGATKSGMEAGGDRRPAFILPTRAREAFGALLNGRGRRSQRSGNARGRGHPVLQGTDESLPNGVDGGGARATEFLLQLLECPAAHNGIPDR